MHAVILGIVSFKFLPYLQMSVCILSQDAKEIGKELEAFWFALAFDSTLPETDIQLGRQKAPEGMGC